MVRELITLPLHVAASTTRVGVHIAVNAFGVGFTVTERLIELALPPEQPEDSGTVWSVDIVAVPVDAKPPAEPATESAPHPAEDAPVQIDEPWEGYASMNAHDVIHRLTSATSEEAAAVEAYERSHGSRKTVLAAAEHRLRKPAGAGSPS